MIARSSRAGRFEGASPTSGTAGHISGAASVPWNLLYDEASGSLLPIEERRAIMRAAGVQEGDTVVAYCHIGQFATFVLLNARTLGHTVMLYDGSRSTTLRASSSRARLERDLTVPIGSASIAAISSIFKP